MVEEKEGKRGKQTHGLLILGGTGESTRRPGPSDEQHTLGVVGLVHPLYSTQYVYQLLHTHRHNNQYVEYVLQYQTKRAAHSGCGAPMVRNVHTHNNCIIDAYCTAHTVCMCMWCTHVTELKHT